MERRDELMEAPGAPIGVKHRDTLAQAVQQLAIGHTAEILFMQPTVNLGQTSE